MKKEIYEVNKLSGIFNGEPYTVTIGDKFNYLTITKLYSNRTCDSICDCGNTVYGLKVRQLQSGNNKSCGCWNRKAIINRNTKHGESKTRLYKIWQGIKKRCYNKKSKRYMDYGGRGIVVCDNWLDWNNFKQWAIENGYTDEMSIERKNYNLNYEPYNCIWIPLPEQSKNRRSCNWITYNGCTLNLTQWANKTGIPRSTLSNRINNLKWDIEKALTEPLHKI